MGSAERLIATDHLDRFDTEDLLRSALMLGNRVRISGVVEDSENQLVLLNDYRPANDGFTLPKVTLEPFEKPELILPQISDKFLKRTGRAINETVLLDGYSSDPRVTYFEIRNRPKIIKAHELDDYFQPDTQEYEVPILENARYHWVHFGAKVSVCPPGDDHQRILKRDRWKSVDEAIEIASRVAKKDISPFKKLSAEFLLFAYGVEY